MRDLTTFEGIAIAALAVLVGLMLSRPGVKREQLALYLGSGCLFEIAPTIFCGIVITCIHYITFAPNAGLRTDIEFINAMFYGEVFINGVFSILPMVIAAFMLGKSAGVGFISTVALGYYTYWLAMM